MESLQKKLWPRDYLYEKVHHYSLAVSEFDLIWHVAAHNKLVKKYSYEEELP